MSDEEDYLRGSEEFSQSKGPDSPVEMREAVSERELDGEDPVKSPRRKSDSDKSGKFEQLSNLEHTSKHDSEPEDSESDQPSNGQDTDEESPADPEQSPLSPGNPKTRRFEYTEYNEADNISTNKEKEQSKLVDFEKELDLVENVDMATEEAEEEIIDLCVKEEGKFENKAEQSSSHPSTSSEKGTAEEDEKSEELDQLTELNQGKEKIDGIKAKDRTDGDTSDDYDFSLIQPQTDALNVEAGRQRALLRQKGSLAGRRKPTRASLRATAAEAQLMSLAPSSENEKTEEKLMNGHVEEMEQGKDEDKPEETDTNTSQASVSSGPTLSSGKTIQGVRTAIVLPGIGDLAANKSKLRPNKRPVPLPRPKTEVLRTSDKPGESNPAWLGESQLLRQARPPRGEVETLKQESEPEKPVWIKDAEMKRKRMSSLVTEKDNAQKEEKDKENEQDQQEQNLPPWMKEAPLRKVNRPGPIMSHKEILHNIDNVDTVLEHDNPFKQQVHSSADSTEVETAKTGGTSDNRGLSSVEDNSKNPLINGSKSGSYSNNNNTNNKNNSQENLPSFPQKAPRNNREILQPIKRHGTSSVQEQDENKPPKGTEITKEPAILRTKDIPPTKSKPLPPLRTPVRNSSISSNEDRPTPSPTSSVVMREKPSVPNKPFTRRPVTMAGVTATGSPMKMWETPQWKKDLMEKKKRRESLTTGPEVEKTPQKTHEPSDEVDSDLPPWKRELQARKMKRSSRTPVMNKKEEEEPSNSTPKPDWMKELGKRRSRFANVSLSADDDTNQP